MKDPKYLNKACEAKYPPSFHRTEYDDKGFPIPKTPVFGLGGLGKRRGAVSSRMSRPTAETVARFKERLSLGLETKQPQPAAVPEKSNTTLPHLRDEARARTLVALGLDPTPRKMVAPISKPKVSLQHLRDEVRAMVGSGKPLHGIPLYRGRPVDGDSGVFLQNHYDRYLPGDGNNTLFMNDLRYIDGRLAQSIANDSRGKSLPIGTRSDLMNSLLQGKFLDGPKEVTEKRVKAAMRLRTVRG